ncbi:MAG: AMP-binding protein [Flavobacteriales bacterium]|nr:AMP-binding protein [Flavobacteriales bacterium]
MERNRHARTHEQAFRFLRLDGVERSAFEWWVQLDRKNSIKRDRVWRDPFLRTLCDLAVHRSSPLHVHTSGTTGPPKPLRIPRRDLVNSARLTADTFDLNPGDRALLCLPCEYIAGKMMLVRAMALGLDLHVIDPRGALLNNLKVHDRFRFTAMVPLQLHRAVQDDRARVERQFDQVLLGGGPVSQALIEDVSGISTRVFLGYGSTETVTHVAIRPLNGPDRQDHFAALGAVTFHTDRRGCLVVRTPHLTVKEHVTNDLVELLDERNFLWKGRADHVILSGGKKIHPEQLESRTAGLIPFPHYFTATPDDRLGQAVVLVLETELSADDVLPEILDQLRDTLSPHELPRRVMAMRHLPRTSSGKVKRPKEV